MTRVGAAHVRTKRFRAVVGTMPTVRVRRRSAANRASRRRRRRPPATCWPRRAHARRSAPAWMIGCRTTIFDRSLTGNRTVDEWVSIHIHGRDDDYWDEE